MKVTPYLILVCVFSGSLTISAQDQNDFSEAINVMELWLDAQRAYDDLPGISVAVVKDQDLVWSQGFGYADLGGEIKTSAKTKYSICSISKLFTAVAIMHLYDAGKLRLDDPIADLLPWFNIRQSFEGSGPITVRTLLTHSSGLPRESNHPYWTGPDFMFPDREMLKAELGNQETLYPASTYFQYSNLGLTLLGEVVSQLSGMSYGNYISRYILEPLKMNDTKTYLPESEWGGQLATGYGAVRRDGSRDEVKLFDAKGIAPAAGFSSTVEDLGKFASWQFRLLQNGGTEILKASTLKYMQQVHWMDPDWKTSWGLGFAVWEEDGGTIVGHGGSCPGYRSTMVINAAKKTAVIVMINASGVNPSSYAKGIAQIISKSKSNEMKSDSLGLANYAGYYNVQPWWSEEIIVPWQGKLASIGLPTENPMAEMTLLQYVSKDVFRRLRKDDTLGEEIRFERDAAGDIVKYWQHNNFNLKIGDIEAQR